MNIDYMPKWNCFVVCRMDAELKRDNDTKCFMGYKFFKLLLLSRKW